MTFESVMNLTDSIVWGWPMILLILLTGIILTFRTGLVQVFHLPAALRFMVLNDEGGSGEISSFGALCTSLSATIGTGNIVGVATAICAGGPGALFWMLVAAFFGMATKYAEGLLAVKYRVDRGNGRFSGGPFYYIENGMGRRFRWLAKLFSLFGVLSGALGIGTITQINSITAAAQSVLDPEMSGVMFTMFSHDYTYAVVITGAVVTLVSALVIVGGVKRIARVSEVVVPFMAITYTVFVLMILIGNLRAIPDALSLIVRSAFDVRAVGGSIVGLSLKTVMQKGIGRGIFSNEAGLGSAPIAAAAARTREPVRQGLVTMTATFIDTMVICTMTGLSIVVTGAWNRAITGAPLQGVEVTSYAWQNGLPFSRGFSSAALMICLAFFAFTTVLGWNYYCESCLEYLSNGSRTASAVFRWIYIAAVFIGPYLSVSAVWGIADIFNALMALPNLVALLMLSGVVFEETSSYVKRRKAAKNRHSHRTKRSAATPPTPVEARSTRQKSS